MVCYPLLRCYTRHDVPSNRRSPNMTLPRFIIFACARSHRGHAVLFPSLDFGDRYFP